ncbi:MAG TPA: hypothetical protein VGR13_05140 [Actinomycetota bacterium]|jgi:predicted transcriptional regulator|nr:hypothetical protein [Actinomycetota bacterium]
MATARSESDVLVAARVSPEERAALRQIARANDRTPSREIRRAIRYYLANYDVVDRTLREQAGVVS